jgi:nicotinate-nucleotide adenylyltransferase
MKSEKDKKIGILGGTFDPVHHAHLILAEEVLTQLKLDRVLFIPAKLHAFKSREKLSPAHIRLQMLQAAIEKFDYFEICTIEMDKQGISYTADTILELKADPKWQNTEFYYIIGMDNLIEFHSWKNPQEITASCNLAVARRPGYEPEKVSKDLINKVYPVTTPVLEISSSKIRNKIKNRAPWRAYVPDAVAQIITKQGLYL